MKFLLDTHAFIWLLETPEKLSQPVAKAIHNEQNEPCGVSDISGWEICKKSSLGKLSLSMSSRSWLAKASQVQGIEMMRLSSEISWESCNLPGEFHRDPADQIIVATARVHGLTLITKDQRIQDYPHVQTLW